LSTTVADLTIPAFIYQENTVQYKTIPITILVEIIILIMTYLKRKLTNKVSSYRKDLSNAHI